jgi:S1-C subfamily serine protease
VRANGHPVATIDQLLNVISEKKPGDSVRLDVYRGTKHLTVSVKLGRLPSSPP